MKTNKLIFSIFIFAFFLTHLSPILAQGTAFTYQGRLNANGSSAGGTYDLKFTLFAGNSSGAAVAGPVTNIAIGVTNGLFFTAIDFGAIIFTGSNYWLEIGVSTNGAGNFSTLSPRQALTPVPYAIMANVAKTVSGDVSANQLTTASITDSGAASIAGNLTSGFFTSVCSLSQSPSQNGALFVSTGGIDNSLTLQNTSPGHYSALRAIDMYGNEVCAWGYGNYASSYPFENYWESYGAQNGWYIVAGGLTFGGWQRHTGYLVEYNGVEGNDTNQTIEFLVKTDGTVFAQSNITTSGGIFSAPIGGGNYQIVSPGGQLNGSLIPSSGSGSALNVQLVQAVGPSPGGGSSGGTAFQINELKIAESDYGILFTSGTGDMLTLEPAGASTPRLMLKQNLPFYPATPGAGSIGLPGNPFGYGNILSNNVGTEIIANNLYAGGIISTSGYSLPVANGMSGTVIGITNRVVDMSRPVQFVSMTSIGANINFLYATNLIADTNYQECLIQIKGDGLHSLWFTNNGAAETTSLLGSAINGFIPGTSNGLYQLKVSRLKIPGVVTNTTYALANPNY